MLDRRYWDECFTVCVREWRRGFFHFNKTGTVKNGLLGSKTVKVTASVKTLDDKSIRVHRNMFGNGRVYSVGPVSTEGLGGPKKSLFPLTPPPPPEP